MKCIIRNYNQLVDLFKKLKPKVEKEPFIIDCEPLINKRSGQQLRAYWLLIQIVKMWMNEKGNNFSNEEVSCWFKIKAGFYTEINGLKIPKSISDKACCTKDDMKNLIDCILDFGIKNDIDNLFIDSYDYQSLMDYYDK